MAASAAVLAAGSPEPSWGPSVDRPTLITTATCPYAQRTWIALHARGVAVDSEVLVDLQSKPEWFFTHNPYGRVPTLVWRAQQGEGAATESVYESLVCNELVAELPGTGPPLLPSEPAARAQVRLLVDQIAARFGGPFGKLMFSGGDGDAAAAAAAELADALRWCEQQKQRASGDAPFWGGSHLNLVDCAFAPFYLRLKVLERLVPGTALPRAELPLLEAWQAALLGHAAVRATMAAGPDGDDYFDHLAASYERFVAARKAAAK